MTVARWVLALVGVLLAALPVALIVAVRAYLRSERARKAEAAGRRDAEAVAEGLREGWAADMERRRELEEVDRAEEVAIEERAETRADAIEAMADATVAEVARWWDTVMMRAK